MLENHHDSLSDRFNLHLGVVHNYIISVWNSNTLTLTEKVKINDNVNKRFDEIRDIYNKACKKFEPVERSIEIDNEIIKNDKKVEVIKIDKETNEDNFLKMILSILLSIGEHVLMKPIKISTNVYKRATLFFERLLNGGNI